MKIALWAVEHEFGEQFATYLRSKTNNPSCENVKYIIDFMTDLTEPATELKLRTWYYNLVIL